MNDCCKTFIRRKVAIMMADLSKISLLLIGVCFCSVVCQNSNKFEDLANLEDSEIEDLADYKLIFAHAIVRHGDRNIKRTYPLDPYKNKTFWPNGYGELSNVSWIIETIVLVSELFIVRF